MARLLTGQRIAAKALLLAVAGPRRATVPGAGRRFGRRGASIMSCLARVRRGTAAVIVGCRECSGAVRIPLRGRLGNLSAQIEPC